MNLQAETRDLVVKYLELVKGNEDSGQERASVIGLLRKRPFSELYAILDILETNRLKLISERNSEKLDECNFVIDSYQRDIL